MPSCKMIKTYERKPKNHPDNFSKSVNAFNALFAQNLPKWLMGYKKKPKFKEIELSPTTESYLTDNSITFSAKQSEDTFDKVRKGKVFNHVKVVKNVYNSSESSSDTSRSRVPQVSVPFHSPILTRKRLKQISATISDDSSAQEILVQAKKNSAFDEPVTSSLSIETEKKELTFSSLSYIQLPKIAEKEQQTFNRSKGEWLCEPIFSETEKQAFYTSTPNVIPLKKSVPAVSPICNSDTANSSKLIEKSYDEIRKWDSSFLILEKGGMPKGPVLQSAVRSLNVEPKVQLQPSDIFFQNVDHNASMTLPKLKQCLRRPVHNKQEFVKMKNNVANLRSSISPNLSPAKYTRQANKPGIKRVKTRKRQYVKPKIKKKIRMPIKKIVNAEESVLSSSIENCKINQEKIESNPSPVNRDNWRFVTLRRQKGNIDINNHSVGKDTKETKKSMHFMNLTDDILSDTEVSYSSTSKCESDFENASFVAAVMQTTSDDLTNHLKLSPPKLNDNNLTKGQSNQEKNECVTVQFAKDASDKIISDLKREDIHEKSVILLSDDDTDLHKDDSSNLEDVSLNSNTNDFRITYSVEDLTVDQELCLSKLEVQQFPEEHVTNSSVLDFVNTSVEELPKTPTKPSTLLEKSPDPTSALRCGRSLNFIIPSRNSSRKSEHNEDCVHSVQYLCSTPKNKIQHKDHSSSISWIIESSIISPSNIIRESSEVVFKKPFIKTPKKTISLRSGKSYRRSLSLLKSSVLDDVQCASACPDDCLCPKCCFRGTRRSTCRRSFQIVPATPKGTIASNSILETYAREHLSYVQEQDLIDTDLDDCLRNVSLISNSRNSPIHHCDTSLPVVTAKDIVLRRCGQTDVLPFEECYPRSVFQKIGEGVYGEVFLYRNQNGGTSVMKVIPIEGDLIVNGEKQKKFEEIVSEIVISMELSNLRNNKKNNTSCFTEVERVRCVRGTYPDRLLDLWKLYDKKHGSENDSPQMFPPDQLYVILELANGGQDLASCVLSNAVQALAVFKQVACTLAVAESQLKFEHRDLHWGNILISSVDKKKTLHFRLDGKDIEVETHGVEVSIIDFTFSRVEFDGVVIFNDLSQDERLFVGEGDYQFDIYRLMQQSNSNEWQHFEAYTNILWLHYLLDKAVTSALHYKYKKSKIHKEYLGKLRKLKKQVLSFHSVVEFVVRNFT